MTVPELPVREPPRPGLRFLARFTVELAAPLWDLGPTTALGRRRIVPITGGRFAGPLLNGEILDHGADVDPADYYFRIHMTFETASAEHGWLNRAVVVASALRRPDAVVYDAYLVA